MKRLFRVGPLACIAVLLVAQQQPHTYPPPYPPAGAPGFGPDNPEGLQVVGQDGRVRYAWLRPVHWVPSPINIQRVGQPGSPPPTAAEQAQIKKVFDTVSGALQATPEGVKGRGFWVNEVRYVYRYERVDLPANAPVAGWPLYLQVHFFPFYHEDYKQNNGQWTLSRRGETESVTYGFNVLPGRVLQPFIAAESRDGGLTPIDFYLRPRETRRVAGLPVYDDATLVVARDGRDPWAPVPLGRLFKTILPMLEEDRKSADQRLGGYKKALAELAEFERAEWERFEKENASLKTSRPSGYETRKANREQYLKVTRANAEAAANPQRGDAKGAWYWNPVDALAEAQKRVASMTPEQAAQPACYLELTAREELEGRYKVKGSFLAAAGAPANCRPVVMDNPEYFDLKLGRVAVQIAILPALKRCVVFEDEAMVHRTWWNTRHNVPPHGCYRHVLMWRELDWSKIAGLVTQ